MFNIWTKLKSKVIFGLFGFLPIIYLIESYTLYTRRWCKIPSLNNVLYAVHCKYHENLTNTTVPILPVESYDECKISQWDAYSMFWMSIWSINIHQGPHKTILWLRSVLRPNLIIRSHRSCFRKRSNLMNILRSVYILYQPDTCLHDGSVYYILVQQKMFSV